MLTRSTIVPKRIDAMDITVDSATNAMDILIKNGMSDDTISFESTSSKNSIDLSFSTYKLGSGGFATVWRVEENAVKKSLMKRNDASINDFKKEVEFLRELDHPNIVKFIYFDSSEMSLFLEFCGNCLFDMVEKSEGFGDSMFRNDCFRQIVSGVAYLHEKGIAHMDLKLENLCYNSSGIIKIIDFGLACKEPMGSRGSACYAAPEVLKGKYTDIRAADMWSVGVILFSMTYGFFPFKSASSQDWRYDGIIGSTKTTLKIITYYPVQYKITNCEDIIDNLLVPDPEKRITAEQAIRKIPCM